LADGQVYNRKSKNGTFLLFNYAVKCPYSSSNYKDGKVRCIFAHLEKHVF